VRSILTALALAGACLTGAQAEAQGSAKRPAKAPDLEGLWSVNSTTKLERASVFPSLVISEAQEKAIKPPPVFADDDVGQEETEWQDEGWRLARVAGEIRTSWLVDPPDGKLPYTEAGQKLVSRPYSSDGPEGRSTNDRCLPLMSAGPPMLNAGGSNIWKIVQTADHVVILLEGNHEARIIPLRPRAPDRTAKQPLVWLGHPTGSYEEGALVVRTTGFYPQQSLRRSTFARLYLSSDAVVTERFRRISPSQVLYSFEVHDPAIFKRDWRAELPLNATRGPLFEMACHEGNYSMSGILGGARREEQDRAKAVAARDAGQAP
jgi:hypothetical protein